MNVLVIILSQNCTLFNCALGSDSVKFARETFGI